jgi:hypothetical protein
MEDTSKDLGQPAVPSISAPTGIDLHPAPRPTVHISKHAAVALIVVILLLLAGLAWGGYRRTLQTQANARQAGTPRTVMPAHADDNLLRAIPLANASVVHSADGGNAQKPTPLQAPSLVVPGPAASSCGLDANGQPMHFNPQTGQPCDGMPQERVVVRQAPTRITSGPPAPLLPAAPAENHALAAAWQREHEAMLAHSHIFSLEMSKESLLTRLQWARRPWP